MALELTQVQDAKGATEEKRDAPERGNELPRMPAAEMARYLAGRPDRNALLAQLHASAGNGYVQEVLGLMAETTSEPMGARGATSTSPADTALPPTPAPAETVTVRIPSPPVHDEVRDAILRGPGFGFQAADMEAFHTAVKKDPNYFYLESVPAAAAPAKDAKATKPPAASATGTHATPAEMETWCDKTTRVATININGQVAAKLHALKATRVSTLVDRALASLPPELWREVRPLMIELLGSGATRRTAASELATKIQGMPDTTALADVFHKLQTGGMESDSLVVALGALATANTAEAKPEFVGPTAKPGIKDPEMAARGDAEATAATGMNEKQRKTGTIDRAEASVLYDITSRTHQVAGNSGAAGRDAAISTFSGMTDKDRAEAKKDGSVRSNLNNAMEAQTETTKQLVEVREETKLYVEEWEQLERTKDEPKEAPKEETKNPVGVHPEAIVPYTGGLALADTWLKFRVTAVRMAHLADLRDREEVLSRKQWVAHHYPIPPMPTALEQLSHRLERIVYGRGSQAAKAETYLTQVRDMIELSHAYYALP